MKLVKITIGAQGSGKSTYSRQFNPDTTIIIERDMCRHAIQLVDGPVYSHHGVVWPEWDWNNEQLVTNAVKRQLVSAFQDHAIETVIISDTHTTPRARKLMIELLKEVSEQVDIDFDIEWVWINTPVQICLDRNRTRVYPIPDDVVIKCHAAIMENESWLLANTTIHDNWSTSKPGSSAVEVVV